MELPRDPQQIMKPGSYSRPVPKVLGSRRTFLEVWRKLERIESSLTVKSNLIRTAIIVGARR